MGEYAIRKSDGARIKIGTCELMYYLRYEDRNKVRKEPNSLDPATCTDIRFRLPFPDEDSILPGGEYKNPDRGERLYRMCGVGQSGYCEDFKDESTVENTGIIQLHHESGLLINVTCYHGVKLPDPSKDVRTAWNGKSWSFELVGVKPTADGRIWPIVHCRHCRSAWRYEWAEIWEYIPYDMQVRLRSYYEAETKLRAVSA